MADENDDDKLTDRQLEILAAARRRDDPTVVEAVDARLLDQHRDILETAESLADPVAVEREVAETHDAAEDALEKTEGLDEWVAVPEDEHDAQSEALEAVEDFLGDALKTHFGLNDAVVEQMNAPAMVEAFRDDDEDGEIDLDALAQHPETGGGPDDPDDPDGGAGGAGGGSGSDDDTPSDGPDYDALSADDRNEVKAKLEEARLMANRTPEYADSLRQEAADIVGVDDADDIDTEEL